MTHVLDAADLTPKTVHSTRLADLIASLDPKIVDLALGLDK
jgi:hypothetical protein